MVVLSNLVHQHKTPWFDVRLYGNHPQMVHQPQVFSDTIDTAVSMGVRRDRVCILVPASGETSDHFQKLVLAQTTQDINDRTWADAAWTDQPDAVIGLSTADCQSVIIKNLLTNRLVVAHGGKPAMTPGHIKEDARWNIIDLCIQKAIERADPSNLRIYVTGTISGHHYWHDELQAQPTMEPFKRVYGEDVFTGDPKDGRLDLFSVTQLTARRWKVPECQIHSDGLCTFKHPHLASYRNPNKSGDNRNIVLVCNAPKQQAA